MADLITCVATSYAASKYVESTPNNSDLWIDELWNCYHAYGNRGAYCVVGAYTIIRTAFDLASKAGMACIHGFPNRPIEGSTSRERTLYGSVYRTIMEIERAGIVPTGSQPEIGSVFFRASSDRGYNHAGIVIDTPLTDAHYITTVEANTTVSGGSSHPKGFTTLTYTREAYERYLGRLFVKSSDAARHYGNADLRGWRFAYFSRMCTLQALPAVPEGYVACLGITIVCDTAQPPEPPPMPTCDLRNPPPPSGDDGDYLEWQLYSNVFPRRLPGGGMQIRPGRDDAGRPEARVSSDGCWVAFRKDRAPLPPNADVPPPAKPCTDTYLLKSACDPDDGSGARTILRFATGDGVARPADLRDYGVCEAMMSSVISRGDHMGRGHSARAQQVYDYVPMIRYDASSVFVLAESSEMYRIFEHLSLWGPSVRELRLDRTRIAGGTGGGWAERMGRLLHPDSPPLFFGEQDLGDILDRLGSYWATYAQVPGQPPVNVASPGYRRTIGEVRVSGFEINLFSLMLEWDKRASDTGQNLVIVWAGEPLTGWDVVSGPLKAIANLIPIPGVGSVVQAITSTIDTIRTSRGTTVDAAFRLTGGIAGALASGVLGDKPFGVDRAVFVDLADNTARASRVYSTIRSSASGGGLQAIMAVAGEFDRQFPTITSALRSEFIAEERWLRNAAADIDRWWSGALGDVRSTAHGIADAWGAQTMGSLVSVTNGIDAIVASLVAEATTITKSVTQLPVIQELVLTKADASLLGAVPGFNKIVANIMSVPELFRTDVTDPATHSALAALASGKRAIDGALDGLVLSSLINKSEDFARKGWDISLPLTLPADKAACYAHEVRVVTGQECCAPKGYVCGTCVDANDVGTCPPGQERDTDGCCVERPAVSAGNDGAGTDAAAPGAPTTSADNGGGSISTGVVTPHGGERPSVLPSCIRPYADGFVYCPSAYCGLSASRDEAVAVVYEEAVVPMMNANGGGFELPAIRRQGSGAWTDFAARPMQPSGNTWLPGMTAFAPIAADQIIPGTVMTSDMFESMRVFRGITPTPIATPPNDVPSNNAPMVSPQPGITVAGGPLTTMPPPAGGAVAGCAATYPARYLARPTPVWQALISGLWVELVDCCPAKQGECCDDLRRDLTGVKVDLTGIKGDVAGIKGDVTGIKSDVYGIRNDVAEMKLLLEQTHAQSRLTHTQVQGITTQAQGIATQVHGIASQVQGVATQGQAISTNVQDIQAQLATIAEAQRAMAIGQRDVSAMQRDLAADVAKMQEGILRLQAGEPIRLDELRADVAFIRANLPGQQTQYDDTLLLRKLEVLGQVIADLYRSQQASSAPGSSAYDDTQLRRDVMRLIHDVSSLREVVETRCQRCEMQAYDTRFDALESMIRAIVIPPAITTNSGAVRHDIDDRRDADYRAYFEAIQRSIADLRSASGTAYDRHFTDLRQLIERLPLQCPSCGPVDMTDIRQALARIEQQTSRNYDAEFAAVHQVLAAMSRDGIAGYDQRFDELERRIAAIRTYEARDYTERFTELERRLAALQGALPREQNYEAYFAAITDRLHALDMRWASLPAAPQDHTSVVQQGQTSVLQQDQSTTVPVVSSERPLQVANCDYRWDEVAAMLQDVRAAAIRHEEALARLQMVQQAGTSQQQVTTSQQQVTTSQREDLAREHRAVAEEYEKVMQRYLVAIQDVVDQATRRTSEQREEGALQRSAEAAALDRTRTEEHMRTEERMLVEDARYDELRLLIEHLRREIAERRDANVGPDDPRIDDILRRVVELQMTTATMSTSIEQGVRQLQTLTTHASAVDAAYGRYVDDLRATIRSEGGTTQLLAALERANQEWAYQHARYGDEIAVIRQRLEALRESVERLPRVDTSVRSHDDLGTVRPPGSNQSSDADTSSAADHSSRAGTGRRPGSGQIVEKGDCPDCPTVVERHERVIYGPIGYHSGRQPSYSDQQASYGDLQPPYGDRQAYQDQRAYQDRQTDQHARGEGIGAHSSRSWPGSDERDRSRYDDEDDC